MSRTDAHRPIWLNRTDPYYLARPWLPVCTCMVCRGPDDANYNHRVARMRQRNMLSELRKLSRQDQQDHPAFIPRSTKWWIPSPRSRNQ